MIELKRQQYASVWDALEDTPEAAENMRARAELMRSLKTFIKESGLSQSQAARLLAVTQPRISDLMRGKIGLFGLEALVNMAARAGFRVQVQLQPIADALLPGMASGASSSASPARAI